jgi:hypothetical protein
MAALFYAIAYFVLGAQLLQVDAAMARDVSMTGTCGCFDKNNKLLATYQATICDGQGHDGCMAAKAKCIADNQANRQALGGTMSDAGPCAGGNKSC